jgi:ATP-dependent protease ClpP protease subunit
MPAGVKTSGRFNQMNWFQVTHKKGFALANIFGEIGVGQTAGEFIADLRDARLVSIRVDCPGGDSVCGLKIHDALLGREVDVTIVGRLGSAALIAVMGAKIITGVSTARLLIHQPVQFTLGNAHQHRTAADGLEKVVARYEQIICERTKQPLATVREWIAGETYFNSDEALAAGLIDSIFIAPPAPLAEADAASDDTRQDADTENERLFMAWLSAFGQLKVGNRETFAREIGCWIASNVLETARGHSTT